MMVTCKTFDTRRATIRLRHPTRPGVATLGFPERNGLALGPWAGTVLALGLGATRPIGPGAGGRIAGLRLGLGGA